MNDGTDAGEGTQMGVQEAALIMREAGDRARHEFRLSHRASFTTWGVALLFGYGAMWLTLRGQQPLHGPDPGAFAAVTLLASGAAIATVAQASSETVAAGGAFAGPVGIWAVGSLAGGLAFLLLAAAFEPRLRGA